MTANAFNLGQLFKQVGDPNDCPTGECTIEAVTADAISSSNGKPMIKVKARIVDGEYAGRVVYDNIVLTVDNVDALAFFYGKLACWGADDPTLLEQCQGTLDPVARAIPGNRARVELAPRAFGGRTRPQVKNYIEAAGRGGDEADVPDAGAFLGDDDDEVAF